MNRSLLLPLFVSIAALAACGGESPQPAEQPAQPAKPEGPDAGAIHEKAKTIFAPLPDYMAKEGQKRDEALIDLGRMLYYDARLSKNGNISCNSCHDLEKFGVDGKPTSPGTDGELGPRNSPTTYNAALHDTQFWDGRSPDVEDQAKGPILNPVEMAMADEAAVVELLKGIPGYVEAFQKAFPGSDDPVTFDNYAIAVGAFERGLVTPGPFDAFLKGDLTAMNAQQLEGLQTFLDVGCATCHSGPAVGGKGFFKLGQVEPYETKDAGRYDVTKNEADRGFFKPPSLRDITKTGPYFHDGSISSLDEAVRLMGKHQLGKDLTPEQVKSIIGFLDALTGEIPKDYIAMPELPGLGDKEGVKRGAPAGGGMGAKMKGKVHARPAAKAAKKPAGK